MVPPLQMSCGGDFFAMIGRVIRAMIGGLFLGFSSTVFLFLFLPLVVLIYYNPFVKSRRFRNYFLLLASVEPLSYIHHLTFSGIIGI